MTAEGVRTIAVIGAGEMGHGLAELAALSGYDVTMRDIKQEYLDRGMERILWSLDRLVEKQQLTKEQAEAILGRVRPTLDLKEAVAHADLVIEAVLEDLDLKKKVFAELDEHAPEHAVLASNTSGLSITAMARATKRPGKVVGMHFFNPPVIMDLVEIVRGEDTSDETVALAEAVARSFKKTPIVVRKDVPGFITTRIIAQYLNEGAWIHHEEGVAKEDIDAAMKFRVGFPMGPFELADQVGIDLLYHAQKKAGMAVPPPFEERAKAGKFGKKTGEGFYTYAEGEKPRISPDRGKDFDVLKILAPTINEAARLVEMDVASPEEIDKAMRLGTAFPKGPLALADEIGLEKVVAALEGHGRHEPVALLREKVARGEVGVASGKGFYDHGKEEEAKTSYETILVERDAETKVATLTLNRPDRLNTLTPEMVEEIDQALVELGRDDDVRCLVIQGAGEKAFCAGADITAFQDVDKSHKIWRFSRRIQEVFSRLEDLPKPTVAAIDGYAYGGGCELSLACDFRLASMRSKIGQTEITLGLIPGAGGSQRLIRLLGLARAKELVMLGSRLTAEEAASIGLVTRAVDNDAFDENVSAFAAKLAAGPPVALRLAKYLLNKGGDASLDAALEMEALGFGIVTSTEDIFEGISAFLSKREPKFKGE
jgi:enoyl-CoA hydratase/3-hydroxyacyl-CoA dehydrogenase